MPFVLANRLMAGQLQVCYTENDTEFRAILAGWYGSLAHWQGQGVAYREGNPVRVLG